MIYKRKILIVDENISYRDMLWQIIIQLDRQIKVQTLWDLSQVINYIDTRQNQASVTLVIFGFKKLTSEVDKGLQQLSGTLRLLNIPVVVYIASMDEDNKYMLLNAGVKEYFAKAEKASEIKIMARRMLAFCRMNEEHA